MQVYALDSCCLGAETGRLRAERCRGRRSHDGAPGDETIALAEQAARRVLAACGEGDLLRTQLAILRRLARFTPPT